mmetsp:Transcript_113488/g.178531  ORF Transcript_113488/g.178531 Transcript_113488/m.178531 type:complete len:230 (-) Transcript_113488:460-1149(-)
MSGNFPGVPRTWPIRRSARVNAGSILVPTPIKPPGTAYWSEFCSAANDIIRERMGLQVYLPVPSVVIIPGRTSISCPTLRTPFRMEPPATPPFKSAIASPGLFTSKERMIIICGLEVKSRGGIGTCVHKYSQTMSRLYFSTALKGIIGDSPAQVPATNFLISSYCAWACASLTNSTLFCKIMMCFKRMISTAAKCSEVCGCGQGSFPATSKSAASITAAPLSMVAMRRS